MLKTKELLKLAFLKATLVWNCPDKFPKSKFCSSGQMGKQMPAFDTSGIFIVHAEAGRLYRR